MNDFFANMDSTLRIYWYIAIASSLIFIAQLVLSMVGADSDGMDTDSAFDGDIDADTSGSFHPAHIFSFRNLIHFLLGMGWTGVAFFDTFDNKAFLAAIAISVGLGFIFIFFVIMRLMMKLAENNSFRIEDTLNKTAEVYLTIPPGKSGKGKVLISVRGSVRELAAMTPMPMEIKSGQMVRIVSVIDSLTLLVEPISVKTV